MSRICRIIGNSWKPRFHELEHESNMRLLKTRSHTSERQGNKAGKVRKTRMKGGPSLKGEEEIVKGNHRHVTCDGGGARKMHGKAKSEYRKREEK